LIDFSENSSISDSNNPQQPLPYQWKKDFKAQNSFQNNNNNNNNNNNKSSGSLSATHQTFIQAVMQFIQQRELQKHGGKKLFPAPTGSPRESVRKTFFTPTTGKKSTGAFPKTQKDPTKKNTEVNFWCKFNEGSSQAVRKTCFVKDWI
jgi:hypothetical protein